MVLFDLKPSDIPFGQHREVRVLDWELTSGKVQVLVNHNMNSHQVLLKRDRGQSFQKSLGVKELVRPL